MRVLVLIIAAGLLATTACGSDPPKSAQTTPPAPIASPDNRLIIIDPKELPLITEELIAGQWTASDGAVASLQHSRRFERSESDPGLASGTTRIDIIARLFESVADATSDFADTCSGVTWQSYVLTAISARGFNREEIVTALVQSPDIGADEHSLRRVEYGRPNSDRFVAYYHCLRVRNTRAIVSTIAPMRDGKEPANLLSETVETSKRQAQRLNTLLQKMPPAPPPRANATSTP